jgi:3-methyladenine DNA glycosylase AlkD
VGEIPVETIVVSEIRARLRRLGDTRKAQLLKGFFKAGPGEYGEGDEFLGIRVPELRSLSGEYRTLTSREVLPLLRSSFHEERFFAILVFIRQFAQGDGSVQEEIYHLYRENMAFINNWDLVDISAPPVVGAFLKERSRKPLCLLAESKSLWERRIAIMATFHFIRHQQFEDTLEISEILLHDREDLIHKATGWMLREVGKRDLEREEKFLQEHYRQMPRTMLRYAIEKFSPSRRRMYLDGSL